SALNLNVNPTNKSTLILFLMDLTILVNAGRNCFWQNWITAISMLAVPFVSCRLYMCSVSSESNSLKLVHSSSSMCT
ncbi:Uncharacterized protein APZ42_004966, partial [Daphnia magna]